MRERGSRGEGQGQSEQRAAARKRTKIHVFPHASSTRGRGCDRLRRQVSWLADHCLPRPSRTLSRLQWHVEESLPLTVAGQPRLRAKLSPRSLLRPAGAGTDQPTVQRAQDASQAARQVRIDKGLTPTIKCRHRRSLMRERTGNVVRNQGFQSHSCPRNCKRRARATTPLEASGKAVTGGDPRARRPAVDSDARRAGCLGAARFARGTRFASSPHGAARVTFIDPTRVAETTASSDAATVYVCITCQRAGMPESEPRPGAVLADATMKAAEGTGVTVRRVRCLANCSRGPSAAMRCNG